MTQIRCVAHPDGCPGVAHAVDGIYCATTGNLIAEPDLVITDWTPYTNTLSTKLLPGGVAARRKQSLRKRQLVAVSPPAFSAALRRLYGAESRDRQQAVARSRFKAAKKPPSNTPSTLVAIMRAVRLRQGVMTTGITSEAVISTLAAALSRLAGAHATPKLTYAALSAFPTMFTATVMDKMADGLWVNDRAILPKLTLAAQHRVPTDQFKTLSVNCRAMSSIARELKANPPAAQWGEALLTAERSQWNHM